MSEVTRAEALEISRHISDNAERARSEAAEREAAVGVQYPEEPQWTKTSEQMPETKTPDRYWVAVQRANWDGELEWRIFACCAFLGSSWMGPADIFSAKDTYWMPCDIPAPPEEAK